jgi:folylpolyglutamate synthase/dihydropteroate synthase
MQQLLSIHLRLIVPFHLTKLFSAPTSHLKTRNIKMVSSPLNVVHTDLMSINTSAEDVGSLRVQHDLKEAWEGLSKGSETFVAPTIEEAVELVRSWNGEKEVFCTGSLHLIGGLYVVLDEGTQREGSD